LAGGIRNLATITGGGIKNDKTFKKEKKLRVRKFGIS